MDSSNSGSFQSSSGGGGGDNNNNNNNNNNDEYESIRTSTQSSNLSSFFNNPSTNFNPTLNHLLQPPQPPSYHRPSPTFYNNNNPIHPPASATWTSPDHNLSNFATYPNPIINPTNQTHQASIDNNITKPVRGSDHNHQIGVMIKNPKKRTRASRRAPTTVLTTDTTNFRQMVQEFTGIPTAPFTNQPFSRRLDLFGSGSVQVPLRPSAHKIQSQPQQPFLNSISNIIESNNNSNNSNNNPTTPTAATTSTNYNFTPSSINDFQKQPSTFLDMQNPMFSFQSLLQNSLPQNSLQQQPINGALSLTGLQTKRWGEESEKMEGFEGVNIGNSQNIGGSNSKLSSDLENVLVSSSSRSGGGGDQVQASEGSWICPSN